MNLKKSFRLIALLLMGAVSLTACSDDDDDDGVSPASESSNRAYVVNGGLFNQNNTSLSAIDLDSNKVYNNCFSNANGRGLGDTGQDAVRYGNKIYIAVYNSNTIEVIDENFKSLKTIQPAAGKPGYPRNLVAYEGKIYVSLYDGYVAKIDTASLAIEDSVAVGPNPEELTIANGYLYVANSDGLNYNDGYANGKSVSKIDLKSFKEVTKIEVLVNPTKITSDKSGNVFVLSMGNYYDIAATIQKIDAKDKVTEVANATIMTCNENTLYTINAPYGAETIDFVSINTQTNEVESKAFVSGTELPANPTTIGINPKNGNIFIGSYATASDYTSNGYVFEYDGNGTFKTKYNVGVGPVKIVF